MDGQLPEKIFASSSESEDTVMESPGSDSRTLTPHSGTIHSPAGHLVSPPLERSRSPLYSRHSSTSTASWGTRGPSGTVSFSGTGSSSGTSGIQGIDQIDIDLLKNYQINGYLSHGSFGYVYLGYSKNLDEDVAIKVLKSGHLNASMTSINSEIDIITFLIENPNENILTFHEVDSQLVRAYIVSEYSPIGDLFGYMTHKDPNGQIIWIPRQELEARHLIQGITEGIAHLHGLGIAHGDLKPENVIICENEQLWNRSALGGTTNFMSLKAKLTDFSNSSMRSHTDPPNQILKKFRTCTIGYASPESYLRPPNVYDLIASDVYSIGCVLIAMLLGAKPFSPPIPFKGGTTSAEKKAQQKRYDKLCTFLKTDPTFVNNILSNFDYTLKQLLSSILDPNPQTRLPLNQILTHQWFVNIKSRELENQSPSGVQKRRQRFSSH